MYTSGFFVFFFSFLAGFIPPLIWLGFWLREDKLHPEPKKILVTTFFAGMIGTILALIFEELVKILGGFTNESQSFLLMTIWVAIEETMKYLMAFSAALWRKENDEPIDNMIYLITAAIGFSSLENLLYLLDPFRTGNILEGVITGNLRFLGTTPLHLLSSAIIGIAMAYAFGKPRRVKVAYSVIGVILAITLHTAFNELILIFNGYMLQTFMIVWIGTIFLALFFEKVKTISKVGLNQL